MHTQTLRCSARDNCVASLRRTRFDRSAGFVRASRIVAIGRVVGWTVAFLCGSFGAGAVNAACSLAPASTWNLGAAGNWGTAVNWNPSGVPNSTATNVCIVDGTSSVALNLGASVGSLEIAAGNALQFNNSANLTIAGSVNNAGTVGINAVGGLTDLIIGTGGTVALSGGGRVTTTDSVNNRIYSNTAGSVLSNVDNTISGAGQIFSNSGRLTIVNGASGVIEASLTNALSLSSFAGANTVLNSGILRSTNTTAGNGGLVLVLTTVDNTPNGNGGRITAIGANTHVDLNSSTVIGGTLTTSGGGTIRAASGAVTLNGSTPSAPVNITAGSQVQVVNNSSLALIGTINNAGTIALGAVGSLTDLVVGTGGTVALSGGGRVTTTDSVNNRIYSNTAGSVLSNVDNTISGAGQIFSNSGRLTIVNGASGVIEASLTNALSLSSFAGANTVLNSGILRSTNTTAGNGGLVLGLTTVDNTPNGNGGRITAIGANTHVDLNSSTIIGGTLTTSGGGEIRIVGIGATFNGATASTPVNLSNGTLVSIANGSTLTLSGTINNAGTIAMNAVGSLTDLKFADGTQLTGGGAITLSNSPNNRIYGAANTGLEVVTNVNNTISGAGSLGIGNQILFVNQAAGTIDANATTSLIVTATTNNSTGLITAQGGGFVNQGVMRATAAGGLTLNGGQFNNLGGTIEGVGAGHDVYLRNSTTVSGGTLRGTGGGQVQVVGGHAATLDGASQGTLNLGGSIVLNNNSTTTLSGTINNTGTISVAAGGSLTDLRIVNGTQLTGGGSIVFSDSVNNRAWGNANSGTEILTNVDNRISGAGQFGVSASFGLVNGGTIDATGVNALLLSPSTNAALTAGVVNQAGGVLRGSGTGGLSITQGKIDNQGTVEALANSAVTYGLNATTMNNQAGNLVGGIWKANSVGGASATITLRGASITTNSADIYLIGANSNINVAGVSIDNTLNLNNGALRLQQGRVFNAGGTNFTNSATGLVELSASTMTLNTLQNNGNVLGFGNSTLNTNVQVTGTGAFTANNGTLTITRGVNMGAGSSMTSNSGATLDLTNAIIPSTIGTLNNNGSLASAVNVNVTKDYTNANFGFGNAFNARANVSGAGQIVGVNAAQTITGNVANSGADTFTLDLGNVRGGSSVTRNYQIANSGTGADIRGAIQTGAPGLGNVTDARLSGAGVTAGNFGPIVAGANSGNLSVTFNATSGGSLSGQSVAVVSNFGNVATQTINLAGTASALAQGSATPNGNPVDLGNFRVGGAQPSQQFAVQNTTSGAGAERLGIQNVSTGGQFVATNNLGAGFINGGASQANAVGVSVQGGVAGVNNGSVTIQYTTNGTLIDPSFTTIGANSQTVNLKATGYNAAVGAATPSPIVFGNVREGVSATPQALTIANTAPNTGFSEKLTATFGTVTGNATTNGGSIGVAQAVAAGSSNNSAMSVGLDTSTAGARAGTVVINYKTDGTGTSGLAAADVNSQTLNVSGNVYRTATGAVNTGALNFGTVQVGQSVQQTLSITNDRAGPAGFVEDLNARFGGSSGTGSGQISGAGSITGLAQGGTNTSAMVVTVNTGTAGTINGAIDVNFFSSGKVGGVDKGLGGEIAANTVAYGVSGLIQTSGQIVNQASPVINTVQPISLGNVRVGDASPSAFVSVTNQATTPPQAALNATIAGNAPITASGSFNLLTPGSTSTSALQVGMSTAGAGAISGTATISFVSDASNIGNCANCQLNLASQNVQVTGNVYQVAQPSVAGSVDLGNVRVGGSANQALTIGNTNVAPLGFQEGLDASVKAQSNATGTGTFTNLVAGGTSSAISVGMTALVAGVNNGSVTLKLDSNGTGTSNLPTFGLADRVVNTSITGYNAAVGATSPSSPPTVDLGAVRVGQSMTQVLSVSNVAPGGSYTERLNASFGANTGQATNNGASVSLLAAGAPASTAMVAGLDTSAAGVRAGSVTIAYQTDGTGTSGLAAASAGSQTIAFTGRAYTPAVAQLNTTVVDFGVVRIGQVVADRNVSVSNAAASTALNDTLAASIASGGSPFTAAGSASGLGAGQSNAAGSLKVGLNTSAAGLFNAGSAQVSFKSQNAEMADQDLGSQSVTLKATVNYFARPLFTLLSGYGLSGGGNSFTLDLGNLVAGAGPLHLQLGLTNADQGGPQDGLRGSFDTSGVNDFAASGWGLVPDLSAGQMLAGLFLDFDPTALGAYTDAIVFRGLSFNASDPGGAALGDLTLLLRANVVDGSQTVPEPGVLALAAIGALVALANARARRRRNVVLH